MSPTSQTITMKRAERSINLFQHRIRVEDGSASCIVTGGFSIKSHISVAHLPQWGGAETEVNLINDEACDIEGYSINAPPKNIGSNFTSSVAKPIKQKERTF